jgi:hypothetical protein
LGLVEFPVVFLPQLGFFEDLDSAIDQLVLFGRGNVVRVTAHRHLHDVTEVGVDIDGAPRELYPDPPLVIVEYRLLFLNYESLLALLYLLLLHLLLYPVPHYLPHNVVVNVEMLTLPR